MQCSVCTQKSADARALSLALSLRATLYTTIPWLDRYEASAQKQASANPFAFSEWANGLRQRQLDDVDDEASVSECIAIYLFIDI